MWKPSQVVPEQRGWAILVWITFILATVGYTSWQIVSVVKKYSSPSTSFHLSNNLYDFPVVTVCMNDGSGCGYSDNSTEACVASALKFSYASYMYETVNAVGSERDNCVKYDMTKFDVDDGEKSERTSATINASMMPEGVPYAPSVSAAANGSQMDWISSNNASMEAEYTTSVNVILGDIDGLTEDMMVPYSRNVYSGNIPSSTTYWVTELTIGKTKRVLLSGSTVETFPVQTVSTLSYDTTRVVEFLKQSSNEMSTNTYLSNIDLAEEYSVGSLLITLTQGSYSYVTITDINPLELATIIGNIGGFWELLVMAWGICFISSQGSRPTLKARTWSSRKVSQDTFRQTPYASRQAATSVEVTEGDAKVRHAWSDKDYISERGDKEEGRNERAYRSPKYVGTVGAMDGSDSFSSRGDINHEDYGAEFCEVTMHSLPRMSSSDDDIERGEGSVGGDSSIGGKVSDGSEGRGGGRGRGRGEALTRSDNSVINAKRSFFSPGRPISTSFKTNLQQTPGTKVVEVTEEEIIRHHSYTSYSRTPREATKSRGKSKNWGVDAASASARWETSPGNIPMTPSPV